VPLKTFLAFKDEKVGERVLVLRKMCIFANMERKHDLKWVVAASVAGDYLLELTFNDGHHCIFDCEPLISQYKFFAPLRDKEVFKHFALDGWTVTWLDGEVDIAPEHLYELGKAA
jgi:hypothetical protein